jgi:hypothetical protein
MALLLIATLALLTISQNAMATYFSEQFDNLQSWKAYPTGQNTRQVVIDPQLGQPSAPSLMVSPAGSIVPDPPGFGDNVTSIYLWNPDTTTLANFTLRFWIRFDDNVGRAMITFRMQDSHNYYAVWLSDTRDWTSRIYKFSNDEATMLNQTVEKGVFTSRTWSHVQLQVEGHTFSLYKDDPPVLILTASDDQWPAGTALGLGIYNGYTIGSFHIDSLELTTREALWYVSMFTTISTSTETSTSTTTSTVTSTSTSTTATSSTTTTTTSTTTTTTSTTTSISTTIRGMLVPVVDWNTFLLLLGVGVVIGVCVADKRYKSAAIGAAVWLAGIFAGSTWLPNATMLFIQASFAAAIGVLIGFFVSLTLKYVTRPL